MSDMKKLNDEALTNVTGGMAGIVDTGTDQNAVVRSGYEQIDSLPNGTNCYMTGRFKEADGRTWAEIDYPVEGWVAASILGY